MKRKENVWCLHTISQRFGIIEGYKLRIAGNNSFFHCVDDDPSIFRIFQQIANKYIRHHFSLFRSSSCEGGFMVGDDEIKNDLFGIGLNVNSSLIIEEYRRATDYSFLQKFFHKLYLINVYDTPAKSYKKSKRYTRVLKIISVWKEIMEVFLRYDWEKIDFDNPKEFSNNIKNALSEISSYDEREVSLILSALV